MKYNRLKFFGLILFSLIINASCSKDSIDINLETCSGCGTTSSGTDSSSGSSSNGSSSDGSSSGGSSSGGSSSDGSSTTKEDVLVSFRPFLLTASSTTTSTSGVSQIATGRNVSVYAYNSGELTKMVNYVSTSSGSLSPVSTGDNMVIPTGTYDFYFVGNNNSSSSVVPTFSLGKLESLSNGIDYISVADKGVVVTGAKDLTVTMAHACTQVVLAFASSGTTTSGTAVTINTLNSAKISASTTSGATWNLFTGAITPVTSLSSSTDTSMGISSLTAAYIMLPVASSVTTLNFEFEVTFTATGSTTSTTNTYTAAFPIGTNSNAATNVSSGLQAGNSYEFQVALTENEITITHVNVKNWVPVIDGTPVVPTQVTN